MTSKLKGLLARVALAAMGFAARCNAGQQETSPQAAPAPFTTPRLSDGGAATFNFLSSQNQLPQQRSTIDASTSAGDSARWAKAYELAVADYSKALAANPTNFSALWGRAASYAYLRENAKAQADYDSALGVAGKNERVDLLVAMSNFHVSEKRPDLAVADIDECLKSESDRAKFLLMRGQIYCESKQFAKAESDITEVIGLTPDSPDGYIYRSYLYLFEKRYAEALEDMSEAIVLDPSVARNFIGRAEILDKMDRFQAELGDLQSALRLSPTDPNVLNGLAWLFATCPETSLRDGKKAVEYANRSAELSNWKDGAIIDTLAAAYAQIGAYKKAADWERKAISLTKDNDAQKDMLSRLDRYDDGLPFVESAASATTVAWETLRYQTFDTVWQTVNESYFDPKFSGANWTALREIYRQKLDAVSDNTQLRLLLGQMLGELHRTHFGVIPKEGAVFNPSEHVRIGSTGAELTTFSNRPAVTSVVKGSPADVSGLRRGDVISSVNGRSLDDVSETLSKAGFQVSRVNAYITGFVESQMTSAVGSSFTLGVNHADGSHENIKVTCGPTDGMWSDPIGYFPSMPIHTNIRKDSQDIAVIKFNVFVPPVMRQIRAFMKTLNPESGLVIDLRGNSGGVTAMAAGICGLLCNQEVSLGSMHLRESTLELEVYPSLHPFAGPVAVLIDSRSASTSEMLAAGIRDIGRARLFGEKSPGMALPSLYKELPTGDLFQYAIADYTTERGTSLEGSGVDPDVTVIQTRNDLANGNDTVLEAAEAWIRTTLQAKRRVST